jgi:ActR/RegA family two-component response regulator
LTNTILIADGHEGRARRLGAAFAARGFTTGFAETGASALEMALAEVPQALLATSDLALIDSARLAEILRANPRTQDIRYVLLGREATAGQAAGLYADVIAPDTDASQIAMRIEAMLVQRARVDAVDRETSADHEVEGKLSQIPLTDLLQVFHMNRRTGTLELTQNEGGRQERGEILLRGGNVIQAKVGPRVEGEKAIYRLLHWRDGRFAFTPNRVVQAARILTPTRALLMDGVRQLDEWDRMRGSLPSLGAQAVLNVSKAELPNAVHPVTQEVLLLLEIYDRVRDVVDHCPHPDYQVLRTLKTLADRGIVELRREPSALDGLSGADLFDAAQVRRLRDWLESGRPRGGAADHAKLLLASPDRDATRDLCRVLEALPGFQLAPEFSREGAGPDDMLEVGRLPVGDDLGLRLYHVPIGRAFAPVWPVLAHGALGTLIVLTHPVDDAEQRMAPLVHAIRRLPAARLFHLLLLRKGERVAPEQIHEKLSLLDSSSLFLLQIESGKDPASLLRTMLARVMP